MCKQLEATRRRASRSGPKFTDIVLRFIIGCVIRSSQDKSYAVVRLSYDHAYLRILSSVVLRHLKGDRKILS